MEKKITTGKRLLAVLLVVLMLLTNLPARAQAATYYYNERSYPTTIILTDNSGERVTGATITVTRSNDKHIVAEGVNGQYYFSRSGNQKNRTYTITVTASGYETATTTMRGDKSSVSISLEKKEDEFATFGVYYTADGGIPDNGYAGANSAADYGPSADDTPLTRIRVNLTKLIEISKQENSPVVYGHSNLASGNQYEFTPAGSHTDSDFKEKIRLFWDAVISCTDSTSIEAFEETGLYDSFMMYCLKKQRSGSLHGDGILNVTPPVYVVELYQNEVYFGGGVTDTAANSIFLTAYDILDQYEAHLKQTITWVEDENGKPKLNEKEQFTGTYVDPATNKIHNIAVFQTNKAQAQAIEGSEIPYTKQTDTYYLSQFNMSVDAGTQIRYLVTYTDGVAEYDIFSEHEYAADRGDTVPAFTGVTNREEYVFLGWYLEGNTSGKIYSDKEIAEMTVSADMVFHAVWQVVPKYTGTVKVIINGKYDSTTQTLISGTLADIHVPLGVEESAGLYVSANGQEYIELTRDSQGVYSAVLENGEYYLYYSIDGGETFVQPSRQLLSIVNADRIRYLFYNTVYHDLSGGTLNGSSDNIYEYFYSGKAVTVCDKDPVREGYIFGGWKSNDGTVYTSGQILTESIDRAYTITAQWIKATDVYVHIKLNHISEDGSGTNNDNAKHNVAFTIDTRSGGSGDFTEIYSKNILWDGERESQDPAYAYVNISQNFNDYTRYDALLPNLTNVPYEKEYTVTAIKSGYVLKSIQTDTDEEGDLHLYVELIYDPHTFNFTFSVELDTEAKALPQTLWPVAANIKVVTWYDAPYDDSEAVSWNTASSHFDTYERVAIGSDGKGTGFFPAWIETTDDTPLKYCHRIEIVSYEMPDGTIIAAENVGGAYTNFDAVDKSYLSRIEVTDGADPNPADDNVLTGAYYDGNGQVGNVRAIISIPVYTVTLMPNGGSIEGNDGNTVFEDQIVMPDVSVYKPTRDGGYVFDGWYLYENGAMTDKTVTAGTELTGDIILIAKWKDPITVSGLVTVGATYEQQNEDGTITVQYIHDAERLGNVLVLLQKKNASGYYETIAYKEYTLDYGNSDYYFKKSESLVVPVGYCNYEFTGISDDGSEYRITILSANYTSAYQNEPDSVESPLAYNYYTASGYVAHLGQTDPNVATVNAHLHFTPPSFELDYRVDATQISQQYRPSDVEIYITYDNGDPAAYEPNSWPVISQMVFGDKLAGNVHILQNGQATGTESVWRYNYSGNLLYDYGLNVGKVTLNGVSALYKANPYYTVVYNAPAHFDSNTGKQNAELVATFVPKTYAIIYEANGGTLLGTYTKTHTWSYETTLSDVVPVRTGYRFLGWYKDAALTEPLTETVIAADVAQDVTYYAKWLQIMDTVKLTVTVDHRTADEGVASNFDKLLAVQLTHRERAVPTADFLPVFGQEKTFTSEYWHKGEDRYVEIFEIDKVFTGLSEAYDYNLTVSLDGYHVDPGQTSVTKIENADGSTVHYVNIYLQFNPDMLDLKFRVEMEEGTDPALYPLSANVKVTTWYDKPEDGEDAPAWNVITQHESKVVEVKIDAEDGYGYGIGSYPVWQWLSAEYAVPYYYRVEVVSLNMPDGTVLSFEEQKADEAWSAGGYRAVLHAENGCQIPVDVDEEGNKTQAQTGLLGAFGTRSVAFGGASVIADDGTNVYNQSGDLRVVISAPAVILHANNQDADCYDEETGSDIFRTYLANGASIKNDSYQYLNPGNTLPKTYDIPTFAYNTHNAYIFKGWYTQPDETGVPVDFDTVYASGTTHIYAHWIETGTVTKDARDTKNTGSDVYAGYDLIGTQIRDQEIDDIEHFGDAGSGLRFITVLSEEVYAQINALAGNESGAEYGFAVALTAAAQNASHGSGTYRLEYCGTNVNGKDTTSSYQYVRNMKCSGVPDHFEGEDYRLYTAVITYNGLEGAALESAYATPFVARSYIRYYDANGLYRTYYNNYTGTQLFGGCNTSFAQVRDMIAGGT